MIDWNWLGRSDNNKKKEAKGSKNTT